MTDLHANRERPLISVVIPSYNSARFVGEALESVFCQSYLPIEVIVVDDGSTDDTATVLAHYEERIRYVYQENRGLAGARNTGIRAATGEWIALLDADDVWLADRLEKCWLCHCEYPAAAVVHTDSLYWQDDTGEKSYRDLNRKLYAGDCYLQLFRRNAVNSSTVLMRRAAAVECGLYDESLRRVEDWDFWLRISRRHSFAYVDEPLALYRMHGASLSANFVRMREAELAVITKALAADPDLADRAGKAEVHRKLYELHFGIGYHYFHEGCYADARSWLTRALRVRPYSARSAALWLATLFPPPIVRGTRWLKQGLFGTRAQSHP